MGCQFPELVQCWLSDGVYDVSALEEALSSHFGRSARLFDYVPMRPSGPKVAVTATNITDASPFVFSNYNGIEPLQRDCGKSRAPIPLGATLTNLVGYRHVRPDDVNDEPFVWQA